MRLCVTLWKSAIALLPTRDRRLLAAGGLLGSVALKKERKYWLGVKSARFDF